VHRRCLSALSNRNLINATVASSDADDSVAGPCTVEDGLCTTGSGSDLPQATRSCEMQTRNIDHKLAAVTSLWTSQPSLFDASLTATLFLPQAAVVPLLREEVLAGPFE